MYVVSYFKTQVFLSEMISSPSHIFLKQSLIKPVGNQHTFLHLIVLVFHHKNQPLGNSTQVNPLTPFDTFFL